MKKTIAFICACLAALFVLSALASCGMAGTDAQTQPPDAQGVEVDDTDATVIAFDGGTASVTGTGASAQGADVYIVQGGTYTVRGETDDGRIVVDADDADVTVILDNAQIACAGPGAICVRKARKAVVYAPEGTVNTLSDGRSSDRDDAFLSQADKKPNACLYAASDLVLAGGGALTVNGNAASGVTCRDTLLLDTLTLTVTAQGDALHADGDVTVRSGDLTLTCGDDAIHAEDRVDILGGDLRITAHEGVEGTRITINDGKLFIRARDDGVNAAHKTKGVTPTVEINGGEIDIETERDGADGVDANGDIRINGGTIRITGQSAFDYDGKGELNGGDVYVNGEKVTALSK